MIKIGFVGGPDTGKTDLARILANILNRMGYRAQEVIEYFQTYKRRYKEDEPIDLLDEVMVYQGQVRRDNDFPDHDFVVCDTVSFLSHVHALARGADQAKPRERYVIETLRRWGLEQVQSYAYVFHLTQTPSSRNPKGPGLSQESKNLLQKKIDAFLVCEGINCIPIRSRRTDERIEVILQQLAKDVPGFASRLRRFKARSWTRREGDY